MLKLFVYFMLAKNVDHHLFVFGFCERPYFQLTVYTRQQNKGPTKTDLSLKFNLEYIASN